MNLLIFCVDIVRFSLRGEQLVNYKKVDLSKNMSNKKISSWQFVLLVFFTLIFFQVNSYGQNCPSLKVGEIVNTGDGIEKGSIEIVISSSRKYTSDNFEIRQKENQVTGPLGYDVEITVSNKKLNISGLRKSSEMNLSEYVILFSDNGCDNGKLVEVGPFKIK